MQELNLNGLGDVMTYPVLPEFDGIPTVYQSAVWQPDQHYQGGGYWAGLGLGQHYDIAQLERLWLNAGGPPSAAANMAYIAEYDESGGDTGDWNSSGATGLWQIEWPSNYKGPRQNLFTPLTQAQSAVKLFNAYGYSPWTGDKYMNLGIPPSKTVPNENKAVQGGVPGNIALNSWFSPFSSLSSFLGQFNWLDMAERTGLVIFGGLLILVGIYILAGKQATKIATTIAMPETSAASSIANESAGKSV